MTHSLIVFNQRLKVFGEMAILQLSFRLQKYYFFLNYANIILIFIYMQRFYLKFSANLH